jgi:hypothetical protein
LKFSYSHRTAAGSIHHYYSAKLRGEMVARPDNNCPTGAAGHLGQAQPGFETFLLVNDLRLDKKGRFFT